MAEATHVGQPGQQERHDAQRLPGARPRLWRNLATARTTTTTTLALFAGFLLLRLPFRSSYPVNWDSVQFGLGLQRFDVEHHQPHPPGYVGYIALGKLINFVVHDPIATLTLMAIVAGAIAPAMFYLLARRFLPEKMALVAAVTFGASTLVWYYSEVALTYIVELAILLPFLLFIHRALSNPGCGRDLLYASLLLAAVGSFRQTALALMLPLWLYALWRHDWRDRLTAGGVLAGASALWLGPLLWLSGGLANYIRLSRELAEITGGNTSVLSMNPAGPAKNAGFVMAGLIVGVNVVAILLLAGSPAIIRWLRARPLHDSLFFALWAVPALAVYLLGHTGQVGYVLMLLPIPFLGLGVALPYIANLLHQLTPRITPRRASYGIIAVILAVNASGLFALPPAMSMAKPASVPLDVRQFDLRGSDAHWREMEAGIKNYPPDSSAVLTTIGGPRVSGSYRHLSYLLPEYHVYGLGRSLENGTFGPLFYAHQGQNDYEIEGMQVVDQRIELPLDVRYVIIPDAEIVDRLEAALDGETAWIDQRGEMTVIVVEPETTVVFSIGGEIITLSTCGEEFCGPSPGRAD